MSKSIINTELSKLASALEEKEEIRINEAATILDRSEAETEAIAKKLAEYGLLEIRYSLTGYKTLRRGWKPAKKDTPKQAPIHRVSPETEKVYKAIKEMSAEKKTKETSTPKTSKQEPSDYERQKRLKEIKDGLAAVRKDLQRIRETLDSDLREKQASCDALTEPHSM